MLTDDQRLALSLERARTRLRSGIGTQSEKLVHTTLKYFLEPDESAHEIPVNGKVADIFQKETGHIYEIQTRNFDRLREKLDSFLEDYRVTVVFPVTTVKYLSWIDPDTGEATERRRSPKVGKAGDILPEIYKLPAVMQHPNLDFLVVLMKMEEFRCLDGYSQDKKRGSHRMERLPLSIDGEVRLKTVEDYRDLVPDTLPEEFDRAQLMKALKLGGRGGSGAVTVLERAGAIVHTDTRGRKYIYSRTNG